jgi:ABC-2 type transport system permease protein
MDEALARKGPQTSPAGRIASVARLAMLLSILFRSTAVLVALGLDTPETAVWTQALSRLSPNDLFGESMLAILSPSTRALGAVFLDQLRGAVMGAPLPLSKSLMIAWPEMVSLIAATIVLFVAGYIAFQRQEIRA